MTPSDFPIVLAVHARRREALAGLIGAGFLTALPALAAFSPSSILRGGFIRAATATRDRTQIFYED